MARWKEVTCPKCGENIPYTQANCLFYYYSFFEPASHIRAICTQDGCEGFRILFGDPQQLLELIEEFQMGMVTEPYPDAVVFAGWCDLKDIPELKQYKLSPRQEKYLEQLHWELDHETVEEAIEEMEGGENYIDPKLNRRWDQ